MQKFNSTDLFTGYLKQLLAEFNLPKIKVYKTKYQDYYNQYNKEHPEILETVTVEDGKKYPNNLKYIPYIKDGQLKEYIDGAWLPLSCKKKNEAHRIHLYSYGQKILNYTKNLKIKNNVYDSYTHEYLGDYLRFKRDFLNIDLMPLYNCFSNRACEKLDLTWTTSTNIEGNTATAENTNPELIEQANSKLDKITTTFSFNSTDPRYKIYMVPVKLFEQYTIAIDSDHPIEFCCGIYGSYQNKREKFKRLAPLTYYKVSTSQFSKPFLYDKLLQENLAQVLSNDSKMDLLQYETDLKLFIKIPASNTSTIVVLEGNYIGWNDTNYKKQKSQIVNIDYWGEGAPTISLLQTLNPENGFKEGQIYLDETTNYLYKLVKTKSMTYRWVHYKYLWQTNRTDELDKEDLDSENILRSFTQYNLHKDTTDYELTAYEEREIAANTITPIQCYFKRYKNNFVFSNATSRLTKYSAYFYPKLKQILLKDNVSTGQSHLR